MDLASQVTAAKALDASIAHVAKDEFAHLSRGLGIVKTTKEIYWALQALEGLQQNVMPTYDAWDSLFYLTWYQPSHINLAYTLARRIPVGVNPLRTGKGRLHVVDFGCGALAMQFGLALAGAETLKRRGACPKISIVSIDESDPMRSIGIKMWHQFVEEISDMDKYPRLKGLRQICSAMKIRKEHKAKAATRWLTALHVAYEENAEEVEDALDKKVKEWEPDVVLVTTHPMADEWVYSPYGRDRTAQQKQSEPLSTESLEPFEGSLEETTKFRLGLYHSYNTEIDRLATSRGERSISYYLSNPVYWNPRRFETTCHLYVAS